MFAPENDSPEALRSHANRLIGRMSLSADDRDILVAEINNAISPAALLADLEPKEVTEESLDDLRASLRRISALVAAMRQKR